MTKEDLGLHAKAFLGARRMLAEKAARETGDIGFEFRALSVAIGEIGNAYYDMWRGCEPGTNEPLEPFEKPR